MVKVKEVLTGKVFGHLTVIKQVEDYIEPSGKHIAQWECECDCENHTRLLVAQNVLKRKKSPKNRCDICKPKTKGNKYDLSGEYGIGYSSNTNKPFFFDLEDYDKISDYTWYEDRHGYLITNIPNQKKKIKMHQIIFGKYCDHKDRNKANNRKNNLRQCTRSDNAKNISIGKRNNTGILGVYWLASRKRWMAVITIQKKKHKTIGYYKTKEEAIKARLEAEKDYYGDFAPQQDLFEQYGIEPIEPKKEED